jgi:hypothetical protein
MEDVFMNDIKNIPLISSEISGLWNTYMGDSLATKVISHFLSNVEDNEIQGLLQHALSLSNQHIQIITDLFNQAGVPLPIGFSDNDVNMNAPRLFTDTFYPAYISFMARAGMQNYTHILNNVTRTDVRNFFTNCVNESADLYNKSADLRLSKGIYIKAPVVEIPKKAEKVKSTSFMIDFFGEKRPLLLNEITDIFALTFLNTMGKVIATAFAQVTKDKRICNYFLEGRDISSNTVNEFTSLFLEEEIPISAPNESYITSSTVSPFSEKLMLFHFLMMNSAGISIKGMALADSLRSDLQVKYIKHITELIKYAGKGSKIAIDNQWLEKPPQVIKHSDLVGV